MMKRIFLFFLLLGIPRQGFGWLLDHLDHDCGVEHVSKLDAAIDQVRMNRIMNRPLDRRELQKLSCDQLCDGCIEIDTVFHFFAFNYRGTTVLPHPSASMQRYDSGDSSLQASAFTTPDGFRQNLRDQIADTNRHLQGTPFRLRLVDTVSVTENESYMRYPMDSFQEITASIGSRNLGVLDVYLSYTVLLQGEVDPLTRVGAATLPSQQLLGNGDGIFLRYDVVTNGGFDDLGVTLTHELGHWLGLYHTFRTSDGTEFGCESFPNDFVDDTPAHQGPSFNFDCRDYLSTNFLRQPFPDTCTSIPGLDPVLNYMNYVSTDQCLDQEGEFTCGQIQRMFYQWVFYREEVSTCPPGNMEIEWAYEFDRNHDRENRVFLYRVQGNDRIVIYDSDIDHDDDAFMAQDVMAVDICVPEEFDYEFVIEDSAGDGFSRGGEVVVNQNGNRVASSSGNWGSSFRVAISAIQETPAPVSSAPTRVPRTNSPTAAPITPTSSPTDRPSTNIVTTETPTSRPTRAPITPTTAPVTPTSSPITPTSAPITPTTAPITPTTAPVTPTSSPITPTTVPITSTGETPTSIPTASPSDELPLSSPRPTLVPSTVHGPASRLPTTPPHLIKMKKSKMSDSMKKSGKSHRYKGSSYYNSTSSSKSSSKSSPKSKKTNKKSIMSKKSKSMMKKSKSMKMDTSFSSSSKSGKMMMMSMSKGSDHSSNSKSASKGTPSPSSQPEEEERDIFELWG